MLHITREEYQKLVKEKAPKSPILKNTFFAFVFGGTICCIGQGISDLYTAFTQLSKDEVGMATSITLIFLGALLTGLGVYDKLARFAGAGTLVPITGFANAIAAPAIEHKSEGMVLGTCVNMFKIAGPVLVCGIVASVACGMLYWIKQLVFIAF